MSMKFDIDYIKQLAQVIDENSLSEIVLENGENAITIRKGADVAMAPVMAPPMHLPAVAPQSAPVAAPVEAGLPAVSAPKGTPITSPMVGAFYKAASPGAKPFVSVGDTVAIGQVVCIVEAMKMMNQIESEVSGKVIQICVEDGQSVEYGQVLMYVE